MSGWPSRSGAGLREAGSRKRAAPAALASPERPARACTGSVSGSTGHAAPAARTEPCPLPSPSPQPAALGSPFTAKFLGRAPSALAPPLAPPLPSTGDVGVAHPSLALPDRPSHSPCLTWWADDPLPLTEADDRGVPRPLSFTHVHSMWKPRQSAATPSPAGPHACPEPTALATGVALQARGQIARPLLLHWPRHCP